MTGKRAITQGALALLSLLLVGPGCSRVHVWVTAYRSAKQPFPTACADNAIAVVARVEPRELLLEEEVASKTETLLRGQGYATAPETEARYILSVCAARDAGRSRLVMIPTSGGGTLGATLVDFTHYLRLELVNSAHFREACKDGVEHGVVWVCTSSTAVRSPDLRSIVDYLLLGAFEHFGEDTGKQRELTFSQGDKRVRRVADRRERQK